MQISSNDWKNYIAKLRKINDTAADKIAQYINTHGLEDVKELIDYSYAIVNKYGEAAAALSAKMYDTIAELSGVTVPTAEVADIARYGDVAKAINGTLKTSENPQEIAGAATRWVKMAGSDTTLKNALRDRAEFAWIPMGETCAFCLTLASNGWQPMSKKALKNGHAEHIHANCDCQYAIRFDSRTDVKGYDPQKYKDIYKNAEGKNPNEKINSIRKMQYMENKDRISPQNQDENKVVGLAAGKTENNGTPEHDPPELIRKLLDEEDRETVLLQYEKEIANEPIENAIVITRDGEIYRCRGTKETVYPDEDLGEKLRGADVTHNHPRGSSNEYSFSDSDIKLFENYELNRLRGEDELFKYELNRSGKVDKQIAIEDLQRDNKSARHSMVIDVAEKRGYGYHREKR